MPRCQGCNAEIDWIKLPSGKSCPVDRERKCLIVGDGRDSGYDGEHQMLRGTFTNEGDPAGVQVMVSHFVTCPQRDRFRKKA